MYLILLMPIGRNNGIVLIVAILFFDMKQIKKGKNNDITISFENSLLHVSGL